MVAVVDIQILENATRRGSRRLLNGLARVVRDDGELDAEALRHWTEVKDRGKALFKGSPAPGASASQKTFNFDIFNVRPLPKELLEYCINASNPNIFIIESPKIAS
jgi:exonuclease 3'-5' domain-containing protein 1